MGLRQGPVALAGAEAPVSSGGGGGGKLRDQ
jgi:hypothetical protein